ncbi:MAG: hypothetical protein ACE5FT_02880 [Candidatus Nanoarchaeia archaeon]
MNATKFVTCLAILLLTAIAAVAPVHAQALPVTIDRAEIDDIEILADQANRLALERGHTYDVELALTALADTDDVEVEAFISGFEYNDIERIADLVGPFDMDAGNTYIKRLKVRVPDDVDEDDYKLRILVSDRNADTLIQNYNLKLDVPRHELQVDDVVWFPTTPEAGKALLTTVRVENKGEKIEDDVKVVVSIPELGVSAVDYIDEIEEEDEMETEELFLRLPDDTKAGTYTLVVEVFYDELYRTLKEERVIQVRGNLNADPLQNLPKTVITVGDKEADATAGLGAATYTITVTNNERNDRLYVLTVENAEWADVQVSPRSAEIVKGGASQIFTVQAFPRADELGTKVLNVNVKQGSEVLQSIPLTANVHKAALSWSQVGLRVLGGLLVVIVAVLLILALVLAFRKMDEDSDVSAEAYY